MIGVKYIKMLVDDIHSASVATIDENGHPQTRIIDMMYYDDKGIYFLTAKGKKFYSQLMEQRYVAISASKDKKAVSRCGDIENIGSQKLDIIFEKNPYMKEIYRENTRHALEVFRLYKASGEYFDISNPAHIFRDEIIIGNAQSDNAGYYVDNGCIGCKLCYSKCPQKCIDISVKPVVINQSNCLHCGNCFEICPQRAVVKKGK